MSKAKAIEDEDIKPSQNIDVTYREECEKHKTAPISQTHTFKSTDERTLNGKVYGAQSDLKNLKYIKDEPKDSKQTDVCNCQIDLRLSKPWWSWKNSNINNSRLFQFLFHNKD